MPSTAVVYAAKMQEAIKKQAAELDYKVEIIENKLDQTEVDQQVQQYLATGKKAAAFLYFPPNAAASVNSARLLSQKAPVIQFNQALSTDAEKYVAAYSGVSDPNIGTAAGEMALKALDEDRAAGRKFNGPDGKPNIIEFTFPTGYAATAERSDAFAQVVGDKFNTLVKEPAGFDAQTGFAAASQIIAQYKAKGIDYIFVHSNNPAVGVVKALEQNGLTPGKDVKIVTGDLSGDKTPLREGKIYSSVVQSPVLEGELVVQTAAKYLATGKTEKGQTTLEAKAERREVTNEPPYLRTYMPSPGVRGNELSTIRIWGLGIDELTF
ncbi:sugar ABC transporter substrate-binding protein [Paenarthrobacter nicotinovorans]|uniref:sugar ABC transporter substrate-binding protein n=1 Tax=Paenarthrobacter nicotinovorans TaxID=29320 RepID=UPI003830A3B5